MNAESHSGVTVTPLTPAFSGHNSVTGVRRADFAIKVKSNPGEAKRTVKIYQEILEQDTQDNPFDADDRVRVTEYTVNFPKEGGSRTLHNSIDVPDTDWGPGDDIEELYHRTRFIVVTNGSKDDGPGANAYKASGVVKMQQ